MVQTTEAKQVCRAASTVLFPALEFGVNYPTLLAHG